MPPAAIAILAAVGDFTRFDSADKLVSYSGLTPACASPATAPPCTDGSARPAAVTSAACSWKLPGAPPTPPGPLRAFYQRIRARRGFQIAVVATARKMTVLAWHLITKEQDYAFARPSLVAHKQRKLELAAGMPSRRGNNRQPGAAYNAKAYRQHERALVEQAEKAYEVLVAGWQPKRPAVGGG